MSVLVKGMKMPERCWECSSLEMNVGITMFGGICPFCVKIVTDYDMETGRHPDCPLVALPDHHGRLIDADALMKRLKEDPLYPLVERYNIEGVIYAEPTIEERKTGRWIPVTERLPKEGVMVLVTCYGRDMIIMRDGESLEDAIERVRKEVVNVTIGLVGSDGWYGADYSPMMITPVAWMPLPEPYEED